MVHGPTPSLRLSEALSPASSLHPQRAHLYVVCLHAWLHASCICFAGLAYQPFPALRYSATSRHCFHTISSLILTCIRYPYHRRSLPHISRDLIVSHLIRGKGDWPQSLLHLPSLPHSSTSKSCHPSPNRPAIPAPEIIPQISLHFSTPGLWNHHS